MEAIRPLWTEMPLTRTTAADGNNNAGGASFTDIFQSAIDAVKETNAEKVDMEYLMATGEIDNPSLLLIAVEKELQATQLLVTLRDKAMDAYNELMRISL